MSAAAEGRSLELYFIEGRPDGMLTAEMFNWTGHVLMTPRTRLSAALARKEAGFTGVYLLLGEKEGAPPAYIGESESIAARIRSHDTAKDWWTSAVPITTAANNLNKAHVKYLEARLVEEALSAARVTLDNGNTPPRPGLNEAAVSNMESFLGYVFTILPALGVSLFVRNVRPALSQPAPEPGKADLPTFRLVNKKNNIEATAVLQDGDFIVLEGSQARLEWSSKSDQASGYAELHGELRRSGVLQRNGEHCVFSQNYAFRSSSAAAAVVTGRPANGTLEWKVDGTDTSYKDWEAAQLEQERPSA